MMDRTRIPTSAIMSMSNALPLLLAHNNMQLHKLLAMCKKPIHPVKTSSKVKTQSIKETIVLHALHLLLTLQPLQLHKLPTPHHVSPSSKAKVPTTTRPYFINSWHTCNAPVRLLLLPTCCKGCRMQLPSFATLVLYSPAMTMEKQQRQKDTTS